MKCSTFLTVALATCSLLSNAQAQVTFLDAPELRPLFRLMREFFFNSNHYQKEEEILKISRKLDILQKQFKASEPFFCDTKKIPPRSAVIPDTVHELRPGDIDIVAAIGDSLSAGNGALATNVLQVSLEYKGVTFSIGGEKTWREYLTVPNIIKEFNPNLYGYSTATGLSIHKSSRFNVAELGAMSRDMPHMTKTLIKRMQADPKVKPEHWKLITFLVGANDFCIDMCYHKHPEEIVKLHESDLLAVLRMLRDSLPRTMVNVVLPPNIKLLLEFTGKKYECETMHHFECPCFFGAEHQKHKKRYLKIVTEWTEKVIEVVNRDEFNRKDFTANIQPFTKNMEFPLNKKNQTDFSYMSLDCFHLSQKGYALATQGLWNNMLQKNGEKSESWNWKTPYKFLCPTEKSPFLATRSN